MKFKYLVVDDESLARKLVISHASKIEGLELAGECCDAIEASNFLRRYKIDLIFLDIQMPEIDGLQLIRTLKNPPAVIFTTAYRDFAPEAFDLDVIDYLIKPISFDRLVKAVNKFYTRKSSPIETVEAETRGFIYLKADRKMHRVPIEEIMYVESLDDYVRVHTKGGVIISREGISNLEEKLGGYAFVRIHRSFLVSTKFVTSISSEGVDIGGKLLPFGRAYKMSALNTLGFPLK